MPYGPAATDYTTTTCARDHPVPAKSPTLYAEHFKSLYETARPTISTGRTVRRPLFSGRVPPAPSTRRLYDTSTDGRHVFVIISGSLVFFFYAGIRVPMTPPAAQTPVWFCPSRLYFSFCYTRDMELYVLSRLTDRTPLKRGSKNNYHLACPL